MSRAETAPAAPALDRAIDDLRQSARRADALASAADRIASGMPREDRRSHERLLTLVELVRIGVEDLVSHVDRVAADVDRVVAGVERAGGRA